MKKHFLFILLAILVSSMYLRGQSTITTIVPKKSQIVFDSKVIFNWNQSSLQSPSNSYSFYVSQDSLFSSTIYTSSNLINNADSVTLTTEGKYFWKVELIDAGQVIFSSETFSFSYSDIYSLPNLSLFFRSDTGVVLSTNGSIEKWTNLADTSNSAVQNVITQQPLLINSLSELKNNSVVRLDGTDDLLQINSSSLLSDVYMIANWTDGSNFTGFNGLLTGQGAFTILAANNRTVSLSASALYPTIQLNGVTTRNFTPMADFKIIRAARSSGFNFGNLNIGRDRTFTNRYWKGDIAELIAFSQPLSDSLKRIVDYYLCEKYSNDLSLGEDIVIEYGFCDTIFTADTSYSNYLWSNGDTTAQSSLAPGNSYQLTVTNQFGCEFKDEFKVIGITVNTPEDQLLCLGDTFIYDTQLPNATYSFVWNDLSTDSILEIVQEGDYYVTISDTNGCSYNSDTLKVSYDSTLFNINLGNDTSLCSGNEIGLVNPLQGIDSYLWSTGSTDSVITVTTSQKYFITVTEAGCTNTDSIDIIIKGTAPDVNFGFENLCFGDTVQFIDSTIDPMNIPLVNYNWNFGDNTTSTDVNPSHYFSVAGSYSVFLEVENDSSCIGSKQKNITIYPRPTANFINSNLCENDTVQFTSTSMAGAGNIVDYSWDFGVTTSNVDTSDFQNPKFKFPGDSAFKVTLEITTQFGCSDTATKDLDINSSPIALFTFSGNTIEDSTRFMDLSSINKGSITTYLWDFGNGLSSNQTNPTVKYTARGVYNVSLTLTSDSNCISVYSDSIRILDPPPVFNTVFPKNNQVLREVLEFRWNEKENADSYEVEIANDSMFSSLINSGRSSDLTLKYRVNSSVDTVFWRVKSFQSGVVTDTTDISKFILFDLENVDSINLWLRADQGVITQNGLVSDWLDQSDSAIQIVQTNVNRRPTLINNRLNNLPVLSFDNVDDQFTTPLSLSKKNFSIFSIYSVAETNRDVGIIRGASVYIYGILNGMHSLLYNGIPNGKNVVSNQFVSHSLYSDVDSVSNYVNNIFYDKTNISFNPGLLTIGSNPINGNIAEILIVNGKISEEERDLIDLSLMNKYAPTISLGKDRYVCSLPDSIDITKDYVANYNWSTGDTTSKVIFTEEGRYYVTITDEFERVYVDSINIILDTTDYRVDFSFEDTTICLGSSIELSGGRDNYTYTWSNSLDSSTIEVSTAGLVKVTTQNCLGNISEDSVLIRINNPSFSLGNDTTICHNEIISLVPDSSFSNVTYLWSTGETSNSILADTSEVYSLEVVDNFGCKFQDTIDITIDSALYNITLGLDTSLCKGNEISLLNPSVAIVTYNWSTGDNTSFTIVDTTGNYTLMVSSNICSESDTISIQVKGDAPEAKFSSSNFCFNDSTSFIDSSLAPAGDQLIMWDWDFGDNTTSTIKNPKNKYTLEGAYTVNLYVETDKGCSDTVQKNIQIHPLPVANFGFQSLTACSKRTISMFDSSSVSSGSIVSYNWNFDDFGSPSNTATIKNPLHEYDTLGNYAVSLIVETAESCRDTVTKVKYINPTPNIKISTIGSCVDDSIAFADLTMLPAGSISSYRWVVNEIPLTSNLISTDSSFKAKFSNAGLKTIAYRVQTLEGCQDIAYDTIQIFSNPTASFTIPDVCEGDTFRVTNFSSSLDSIVSYQYIFNGKDTSSLIEPSFFNDTVKSYLTALRVTSINACTDSTSFSSQIRPKPDVDFSILNNETGVPFPISLTNTTTGGDSYFWDFGTGDTSQAFLPSYTYRDTGRFEIKLRSVSDFGCEDSLTKELIALPFYLDALLNKVFMEENQQGDISITAQVFNSGFNTIEALKLTADLNNKFRFSQQFATQILKGESTGLQFDALFAENQGRKVDFICVRIESVNGINDSIQSNNEICQKTFNDQVLVNVYPNPVEDLLNMEYVLPEDGDLQINVFDELGKSVIKEISIKAEEGYYSNLINVVALEPGIYFYRFEFNGVLQVGKFLKN